MMTQEEYLTVAQAAAALGVSVARIKQLIALGTLAHADMPIRAKLIPRASFEAYKATYDPTKRRGPKPKTKGA